MRLFPERPLYPAQKSVPELPLDPALEPFLTDRAQVIPLAPLETADGTVRRCLIKLSRGTARAWVFPDGSLFWCEQSTEAFALPLSGFTAETGDHLNADDTRSPFLIETQTQSALLQPPLAREPVSLDGTNYLAAEEGNGSILYRNGTAVIRFEDDTYASDWWVYLTPGSLTEGAADGLEWLSRCAVDKFGGINRMTRSGYYYATPTDYVPTGEGCFYLLPAAHIPTKLARWSDAHHGRQIAAAMLDLQRAYYLEDGFIPTAPTSGWLSRDYGIGAGFYDTRFNTDLAHALLTLGRDLGIDAFTDCAMRYAGYLLQHAALHSTATENGILVHDYAHPDGNHSPTHTSLNHQLAEILFLIETQDGDCAITAGRMLRGIADTLELWIREDGNLHYACYPDGSFGGEDYPFLTYNDLLALNRCLGGHAGLERLMQTKQAWMDRNGVTAYNK